MIFSFWKENQVDGFFEMTSSMIKNHYHEWMEKKGAEWVKSNYHIAEAAFVADPEGLNATTEQMPIIKDVLHPMTKAFVEIYK